MFNVQRAFLNATGPLCGLHDCIENDSAPSYEEIKEAWEQALFLLASANAQLSISRRQRVLAAINRSRTNLAELPLPNVKSWLYGDDFPSLASKQAELSRGLTKNLAHTTGKSFPRLSNSSQSQSRHRGDTLNKYQCTGYQTLLRSQSNYQGSRSKNGFFRPPHQKGRQPVHSVLENSNIGPTASLNCVRLQDKFPRNSFSRVSPFYLSIGSGGTPSIPEGKRVIAKGAIQKTPFTRDGFYSRLFLVPKKGGSMRPVIDVL